MSKEIKEVTIFTAKDDHKIMMHALSAINEALVCNADYLGLQGEIAKIFQALPPHIVETYSEFDPYEFEGTSK